VTGNNYAELAEFDATLSNHNRADFLQFLFSKNQVFVAKWTAQKMEEMNKSTGEVEETNDEKASTVAGYLVGLLPKNELILLCSCSLGYLQL
jgi:hypothetical protein